MSDSSTQLNFAIEFATFLVAVAGAAVMLLRPALVGARQSARILMAFGFVSLAAGAFLHGSLVVDTDDTLLVVVRGVGIILLAVGNFGTQDRTTRRVLWGALALLAIGEIAGATGADGPAAWARALGALGLGAVLVVSARRSIPARIAVGTAATLLLVVLAVSVALSVVIGNNVEREAVRRIDSRASAESQQIQNSGTYTAATSAKLIGLGLQGQSTDLARRISGQTTPSSEMSSLLTLVEKNGLLLAEGPLLYVNQEGRVLGRADGPTTDQEAVALAGSQPVNEVLTGRGDSSSSVEIVGDDAFAVGVFKVADTAAAGRLLGVVISAQRLGDGYVKLQQQSDKAVGLALVDREKVLAQGGGDLPPEEDVVRVARAALTGSESSSLVTGDSFLAAEPVRSADGVAKFAVVGLTPRTIVDATRNSLYRTLFVVALITALAGVVLALFLGEQIGSKLRKLTVAAEGIQAGDLSARAAVTSLDELGVLGSAFDSMAGSIESQANDLRNAAEEEARLRSRLEAVVGGMGEALLAVDPDGKVTTFNDAAEELFGIAASQVVGRRVPDVTRIVGDRGDDLAARLSKPAPGAWSEAGVVVRDDGTQVPVALSAGGLRGPRGGVAGGVYVLRDMRREREVERMKTEFLSNISHELRTPLVPIKGFAELLRTRKLPREQSQDFLGRIVESAAELERVVDLLVSVAADEAARLTLRNEPVVVRQMVLSVIDRWKHRVGDRHEITRRVAGRLPTIEGDRHLLERSLNELVDNAIKYSPNGGKVTVTAALSGNGNSNGNNNGNGRGGARAVAITIRDEGVGISPERLRGIFDDFAQVDSSATREFGGLGLGLGFVRRVVRAHHGQLTCESELGKGSSFTITLPISRKREPTR
ncbi:MAG: ATP-binding protein [Acidimicrobiales bacterium]